VNAARLRLVSGTVTRATVIEAGPSRRRGLFGRGYVPPAVLLAASALLVTGCGASG
jgi:hypothetical protein